MKTKTIITLSGWCVALSLTACDVKDPIFNTSHPDHGVVTLTTEWSGIGEGLTTPESYTVKAGDYTATLTGVTNKLDHLFSPATYRFLVYNTPKHITVSGTSATVEEVAVTSADGGSTSYETSPADNPEQLIHNAPQWLFTSVLDAAIAADTEHALTAPMQQQVRRFTLNVEPGNGMTDMIESITGTLSGVAGSLDIADGTHGTPSRVALTFTKITSGADAGKWSATVYLLGIAGTQQRLMATIVFAGDNHEPIILDRDLTTTLAAFNADKRKPFTLGVSVLEKPLGAMITDYTTMTDSRMVAY